MNDKQKVGVVIGLGALTIGAVFLARRQEEPPEPLPGLATLYGKVTDSITEQPVAGVLVTLGINLNTQTNTNGNYALTNTTPGEYGVAFIKDGYQTLYA